MKTYSFDFQGQPYKLAGLTTAIKDEWMDPVRATLSARAKRMHDKKLIDDREFARRDKSAFQAGFHCDAAVEDLATEEGRKRLVALMLIPQEAVTPKLIDDLYEESKSLTSSFSVAMGMILKEAYPDFKPDAKPEADAEGEQSDPKLNVNAS